MKTAKPLLFVILSLAVLGTALATDMALAACEFQRGAPEGAGCVTGAAGCARAAASREAYLIGIPVSAIGAVFCAWIALVACLGLARRSARPAIWRALVWAGAGAAYFCAHKTLPGIVLMAEPCTSCIALHVVVLGVLLLAMRGSKISRREAVTAGAGALRGVVALLFALGAGYGVLWSAASLPARDIVNAQALQAHFTRPIVDLPRGPQVPTQGPGDAPVRVAVFSDFQCVFCADVAAALAPYERHIEVSFFHNPLDAAINPYGGIASHDNAGLAARAGVLANELGLFWAYHDHLFANQEAIDEAFVLDWFEAHGLERREAAAALARPDLERVVRGQIELAHDLGVQGTPHLFVNGRAVPFNKTVLDLVIREELRRAGADTVRTVHVSAR